jgi:alanyl-tRNA synthetase
LIADGVRPGNEGRNYVLRRILRRAAYQGQTIGLTEPFLAHVVDEVITHMGNAYPELRTKAGYIKQIVTGEEEQFGRTLQRGLTILEGLVAAMQRDAQTIMAGDNVFDMHDTYGFPPDLTAKILSERNLGIDEAGYHAAREQQRQRGRQAAQFRRGAQAELWTTLDLPQTTFAGYTELQTPGHVLTLVANDEQVQDASEGEQVQIVLNQTCFYAESGGQVGDTGVLVNEQALVRVTDVQKPVPGVYVHSGTVERGTLAIGDTVEAQVDGDRRRDIMRNHTATHLLHRALRDVLGSHAEQAGSLVAPDRLRFDFGHGSAIAAEDLREIERRVNAWVRADTEVEAAQMPIAEARAQGAMALFGEKYGDVVRVVTIGCDEKDEGERTKAEEAILINTSFCSRELCGGTHVGRTGEIGYFRIANESSIGSGLRRIEALTGAGAEQYVVEQSELVREAARRLNTAPTQLLDRIEQIQAQVKQQQQHIAQLERQGGTNQLDVIMEQRQQQDGVAFVAARVDAASADKLRTLGDQARAKIGSGVIVLGSVINDKPQLLAMVTPDLVSKGYHAGNLVKTLAQHVGGGGGGRADVAQAGGRDVSKLDAALGDVGALLAKQA